MALGAVPRLQPRASSRAGKSQAQPHDGPYYETKGHRVLKVASKAIKSSDAFGDPGAARAAQAGPVATAALFIED